MEQKEVKFPGLDFKYWSPKGLSKIGSLVGKTLMAYQYTEQKVGLSFTRLLIEVEMDQNLPEKIQFRNEKGIIVEQRVIYDLRPYLCKHCQKYGHTEVECRKKKAITKILEFSEKHEENQKKGDQVAAKEKQHIVTQNQQMGESGCAFIAKSPKKKKGKQGG